MKTKQLLFIAIVAAILVTMVSIPVAAEDEIPMWVNSIRLTLKGRADLPSARLLGTVSVRDANHEPVAGANVVVEFRDPEGWVALLGSETSQQGTAAFRMLSLKSGWYELCVFTVSKEGWEYVPGLNKEDCETILVP